jgi:hypothetical protein
LATILRSTFETLCALISGPYTRVSKLTVYETKRLGRRVNATTEEKRGGTKRAERQKAANHGRNQSAEKRPKHSDEYPHNQSYDRSREDARD